MKGSYFSLLLIVICACNSPRKDKIVVPELHAGFYIDALNEINDKLESDPDNNLLVGQKLYYCDQLDWPSNCIDALNLKKDKFGMSNQLVRQFIKYYQIHNLHADLIQLFDKWDEEYDLKEEYVESYIDALIKTNKRLRAQFELRSYLNKIQSEQSLEFASSKYLEIKDTVMAVYNLGKLYKLNPDNELMWNYGYLLTRFGYLDYGIDIIDKYLENNDPGFDQLLAYSHLLQKMNKPQLSRKVLTPYLERDTVVYFIANSFKNDLKWDSASYVLESLVEKDSSNRKAIWKTGRLYEDRGWLLYAIRYFEYLKDLNPNDTLASQRIDLIQRKIAYLQRLKFEESKTPALELQPKKIEN